MKRLAALLLLAVPALALARDVHLGDSLEEVRSALGEPRGQARLDGRLVLFYDRGEVELVDGRVTNSDFLSSEDFAALQAQHAAEAERAAQVRAEGEALKAKKLADPAFASAPPAYQVAFWEDFHRRYPQVSCDDEYNLALARRQEELDKQAHDQNVTDLQNRATEAENRAAEAEREAQQARTSGYWGWPVFFGDTGRRHEHDHDRGDRRDRDRDRGRPTGPTFRSPSGPAPSSPVLTQPPSASGLKPPPSASGLTPPPSAWPSH
ncbi:MAG TPA: hypothetical protein VFB27_04565 [Opitutaceae bacterium]|nr:hypothetical protein [Opitutaceae bacterium]